MNEIWEEFQRLSKIEVVRKPIKIIIMDIIWTIPLYFFGVWLQEKNILSNSSIGLGLGFGIQLFSIAWVVLYFWQNAYNYY